MVLAVADTGATGHMCPERFAFVLYHPVTNYNVCMGSKNPSSTVISLNGKLVLVRNILHVPTLCTHLYSIRKHLTQLGCGFLGDDSLRGLFAYFQTFVLAVNTKKY